jgi:hypothetical protein
MPGFDAATGTIVVPIWTAGAASAIFVVAVVLAIARAGAAAAIGALFGVVVAAAIFGGWFYLQTAAQQEHAVARRALDERAAALTRSAVAPGSALACLDELAGERVEMACEKAIFASPEAVAAAVSYITAKLALLADGNAYARQIDPAYERELAPLRGALELDRFGLVAHILAGRDDCTQEDCAATAQFRDRSRVLANLRDRTFDEQLGKYAVRWNASTATAAEPAGVAAVPPTGALPRALGAGPATVSPRYDFPSSRSIPAVNIMAAEPVTRAVSAPSPQPVAAAPASAATAAPVPPRRPLQSRASTAAAAPSRPPAPQPAAATDAPADGAASPAAVPPQPR